LAQQRRARHAHALVAAGQCVELEQEGVEQHAEGEGEHAEEDLGVARAKRADRQRHEQAGRGGGEQRDLEAGDPPHPDRDGRGVGADGDEHRVPEGHEPAVPEQQVEPEERHAVPEHRQQQRGAVLAQDQRQRREGCQHGGRDHSVSHAAGFPNRPAGRSSSTATTTA
jgi:hypothetical protein